MGELYSITGLFYESFPGICPWGGFIMRGVDEENRIEGQLIDSYGPSRIDGFMNADSLNFVKRYSSNEDALGGSIDESRDLTYNFVLGDGIWKGSYASGSSGSQGSAICKTHLIVPDIDFKRYDLSTPENYASALIDSMIESGQLEVITDPDGGEDMIRPV